MLPIIQHIPEISTALERYRCAVVMAPPGAGKTTEIPPAFLDAPWLKKKKILLLEPRRIAAVSCAGYMARNLGKPLGDQVGYRIRLESRISRKTKIEVMTEGIFTRRIQNDPGLEDVGLVIFDEFHERNIHSDLGLALCLDTFEVLREDLRILVMSATMDTDRVSRLLGGAPVIVSKGQMFPVQTCYLPPEQSRSGPEIMVKRTIFAVRKALKQTRKDILVFLPGLGEIRKTARLLEDLDKSKVQVHQLHGGMPADIQAAAILPSTSGKQKIVLSTAVAETSITINGVDTVIDSGWMRISQFSAKTGMDNLTTLRVSRASADQRRGRAGRTGPGNCYRLWSEYEQGLLKSHTPPEILRADLSSVVLELAAWGEQDFSRLKWMDNPFGAGEKQAGQLLETLGALDHMGRITDHGKQMASAGLHPRLSHMIIVAAKMGLGALACRLAAFLNEKDFLFFEKGFSDPDILLRLEWLEKAVKKKSMVQKGVRSSHAAVLRILKSEKKIQKDFQVQAAVINPDAAGRVLSLAYPDRIAAKRTQQATHFLTTDGKGIYFPFVCSLSAEPFIVAVQMDGKVKNSKIFLAAACSKQDIETTFAHRTKTTSRVFFDKKTGRILAEKRLQLGAVALETKKEKQLDSGACAEILTTHIKKNGLHLLPWNAKLSELKDRIRFLKQAGELQDLPDVSDQGLIDQLENWLSPFLGEITSLRQLEKMDLSAAFLNLFSWEQQKKIDRLAPAHLSVPSGSKRPLRYRRGKMILDSPILEVRLQEMFGQTSTPVIANGRIPVTIALLSPAGRPVQITKDLDGFWKNTYPDVKKEMAGRYPKHHWPENPLKAIPTSRAKPRNNDKGRS